MQCACFVSYRLITASWDTCLRYRDSPAELGKIVCSNLGDIVHDVTFVFLCTALVSLCALICDFE